MRYRRCNGREASVVAWRRGAERGRTHLLTNLIERKATIVMEILTFLIAHALKERVFVSLSKIIRMRVYEWA